MIESICFIIGVGIGAWGYRYALKRNPDAVARLGAEIRRAGSKIAD